MKKHCILISLLFAFSPVWASMVLPPMPVQCVYQTVPFAPIDDKTPIQSCKQSFYLTNIDVGVSGVFISAENGVHIGQLTSAKRSPTAPNGVITDTRYTFNNQPAQTYSEDNLFYDVFCTQLNNERLCVLNPKKADE